MLLFIFLFNFSLSQICQYTNPIFPLDLSIIENSTFANINLYSFNNSTNLRLSVVSSTSSNINSMIDNANNRHETIINTKIAIINFILNSLTNLLNLCSIVFQAPCMAQSYNTILFYN